LLSSFRDHDAPGYRNYNRGFRCVLAPAAAPVSVPAAPTPLATGAPASPDAATKDQPFVNTLGMKFVPVPIIGGPTGGQRVLFSVWETRVQDYEPFVDETQRRRAKADFPQGPTHPAVNVSWEDARLFCQWLTQREQAAGRLPAGFSYRLPSDHEWSCAADIGAREDAAELPADKAGKIGDVFPWGAQWPPPKGAGNYLGEELHAAQAAGRSTDQKEVIAGYNDGFVETSPVGSFAVNRFGLFDIGGNAWQWCEDWYDREQKRRVLRGASWHESARSYLLSSYRHYAYPDGHYFNFGFRCVLAPPVSASPGAVAVQPAPPSTPAPAAVSGMNCATPIAPADEIAVGS